MWVCFSLIRSLFDLRLITNGKQNFFGQLSLRNLNLREGTKKRILGKSERIKSISVGRLSDERPERRLMKSVKVSSFQGFISSTYSLLMSS